MPQGIINVYNRLLHVLLSDLSIPEDPPHGVVSSYLNYDGNYLSSSLSNEKNRDAPDSILAPQITLLKSAKMI